MLFIGGTGGGVSVLCAILGVQLQYVCSLLSCVGLQLLFVHIRCLLLVGTTILSDVNLMMATLGRNM